MTPVEANKKVAVITGATGFVGSHLARALVQRAWTVHAFKRKSSSMELVSDVADSIVWHDADQAPLNIIWDTIGRADVVYHLATEYGRNQPPSKVVAANLLFPVQLMEQAEKHNVSLFVAADTCFPRTYPYLRHYTLSKKQLAQWGNIWAEQTGRRFVNLVLQHPYGPGDRDDKFVPWIIDQCLQNAESIELTSGEQQKDFVYIDDVVDAFIVLHDQQRLLPTAFADVPCGSGVAIPLSQFIETVHSLSLSSSDLQFGALPNRAGEMQFSCADTTILSQLGWSASTSLKEGVQQTLAHQNRKQPKP